MEMEKRDTFYRQNLERKHSQVIKVLLEIISEQLIQNMVLFISLII